MMHNPYVSRGPVREPELFFGRRQEFTEIAAFLRGNQSVSLMGPRKIGKTSLLYHLMRPDTWPQFDLEQTNLYVYLDCSVLGEGSHEDIFGEFAAEMEAALETYGHEPEPALERALTRPGRLSFEGAVRRLNQRDLRVVLVLDDFERLSTNPSLDLNFFNALRSAAGRYQLVFLTASASPLIELTYSNQTEEILTSPFFNIFAPLFLTLLVEEEARELIREPAYQNGVEFSQATEDFIYGLVGGHAFAIQVACYRAFEAPDDLSSIEEGSKRELESHFQYYWQNLSSVEQDTLARMDSAVSRATGDTSTRTILRDLVRHGYLLVQDGIYTYPSRAWAEFIADQTPRAPMISGILTGTQFGPYEVHEPLGRGGMAEVYKGVHTRLDREVAVKVLSASMATQEDFRMRFEREARAIAGLRHPNIVQVFDFGDIDGMYYMVMEFIAGDDLSAYMSEHKIISLGEALFLIGGLAEALNYAHGQALVHRDVKPSNVLLRPTDDNNDFGYQAVLTDFGIAKILAGGTESTKTGMMMGTLDYMAPEQIHSPAEVDSRADIYALGVMLYHMLTGRLPFIGDNPGALIMAHLQEPVPDPRLHTPDIPHHIAEAIMICLSKDPDERYQTADEFITGLEMG